MSWIASWPGWRRRLWSARDAGVKPPGYFRRYQDLVRALNEKGAEYLLIGGYALFAHGHHRATTDIDVLVPSSREAGRKVREALMVLPDQASKDLDPAWFEEGENIRVADAFAAAKALIDRGVAANGRFPAGRAYLLQTPDKARSVRAATFEQTAKELA